MNKPRPHGKWSQPDVPHRNWTCEGVTDLGEPSEVCEMCEQQTIRYVHHMTHPDYPDQLDCGCVCSAAMELDSEAAEVTDNAPAYERERLMKNAAAKRTRDLLRQQKAAAQAAAAEQRRLEWEAHCARLPERDVRALPPPPSPAARIVWGTSKKGNPYGMLGRFRGVVFQRNAGFAIGLFDDDDESKTRWPQTIYGSRDAARIAVETALQDMAKPPGALNKTPTEIVRHLRLVE